MGTLNKNDANCVNKEDFIKTNSTPLNLKNKSNRPYSQIQFVDDIMNLRENSIPLESDSLSAKTNIYVKYKTLGVLLELNIYSSKFEGFGNNDSEWFEYYLKPRVLQI